MPNHKEVIEVIKKFQEEGRNFLTTPGSSTLDENSIIDISHESLIRNWSKLAGDNEQKGWVEEGAESRANYLRIVDAVGRQEKGEVGYWRDPDLAFAFKWKTENEPTKAWGELYEPDFDINKVFTFLEESQRQQLEEQSGKERLRRRAMLGLGLGFAVAVLFATFAGWQWWRAEQQRMHLKASAILTDGSSQQSTDPTLGLLLLTELSSYQEPFNGVREAREFVPLSVAKGIIQGHTGFVNHATFSPDGQRVVTASGDETARVWQVGEKGVEGDPIVLEGHTEGVNHATFSPDGQRVVTASGDKTARVWRVGWKEILTYLRSRTTACLNVKQRLRYLVEEPKEGKEKYEACERGYGRGP